MSVFIRVYAITLWPFIFIRDEGNNTTLNHERIHIRQQAELWVIGFYILYVLDWFKGLRLYDDAGAAYTFIRFEQEAYENQNDAYYWLTRKKFAWKNYIV